MDVLNFNVLAGLLLRLGFLIIMLLLIVLACVYIMRWITYHWHAGKFLTPVQHTPVYTPPQQPIYTSPHHTGYQPTGYPKE
jgi:hypothetical protein